VSRARGIGQCETCGQVVYGGDGTPDNPGRINRGGKRVPHTHKRPYTVRLYTPDDFDTSRDRDWHDQVPGFVF